MNSTYAVEKKKPEINSGLDGIEPMTSAIPVQHSNQLSFQAKRPCSMFEYCE